MRLRCLLALGPDANSATMPNEVASFTVSLIPAPQILFLLACSADLEYKYVVVSDGSVVEWQPGMNRSLAVPATAVAVYDDWDGMKHDLETTSATPAAGEPQQLRVFAPDQLSHCFWTEVGLQVVRRHCTGTAQPILTLSGCLIDCGLYLPAFIMCIFCLLSSPRCSYLTPICTLH